MSSRGVSIKLGSGCSTHSAILNSFSARRFRSLPPYFLLACFPRAFTILNLYIQSYTLFLIRKLESAWERGYIQSAYRIIPVHPSDRHLLGMFWRDCYYIDLTLRFGLRSAPAIFNTVADSFHWCLVNNWNVLDLLHYLGDYFTLGPPNSNICASRLKAIDRAASDVGIPLPPDKCVGPTTCLVFLGIELDSIRMTARLPADKHAELIALLDEWANKRWCKLKALQSLVGKLSHACTLGRTFLRVFLIY